MIRCRLFLVLFVAFVGLAFSAWAQTEPQAIPAHEGFIADTAGVLSPAERDHLAARLRELSRERGSQLGVIIVERTDPETIEALAQRVFTTWRLGRKGIDDGVLFVLAVKQPTRRMRIHVGYGLEGAIPDAVAKRILAEQVRPALEASGPAAAVSVAVDVLLERMWKSDVAPKDAPQPGVNDGAGERLIMGTAANIVLLAFAGLLLTRRVRMVVRYAIVWLVGGLAFLLYACTMPCSSRARRSG